MNRHLLTLLVATACVSAHAVGDKTEFEHILEKSGYVHTLLPLDREHSLEAKNERKTVLKERGVDAPPIVIKHATSTGRRAVGSPDDPDYALYGHRSGRFAIGGESWEDYNRIAFDITPHCEGARVVNLTMNFVNDPSRPGKAGYNAPTGAHFIPLENGVTNHCYLEIADLQRDAVKELVFSVSLNGRDITTGDSATYVIDNLRLQLIDDPELVAGWQPRPGAIIHSMTGYDTRGKKTAVIPCELSSQAGGTFAIIDSLGQPVFSGPIRLVSTTLGTFGEIDFSDFASPGRYSIKAGEVVTPDFGIGGSEIWDKSTWLLLNYIFGQRCGYHVAGIHGKCHTDLFAVHDGVRIPYSGGWHDAGDLSQQTLQTADVAHALLEAANKAEADGNAVLAARLREEAMWGIDFVLRSRFGDGYRASSMGLLLWQDGMTDSFDDINTVRVQDVSFDNFLHAGYGAYAAMNMPGDEQLCKYLEKVAIADFDFASKKYDEAGFGGFISPYEHSYNTSMSQFMATRSWAASQLYKLTGDAKYAALAAEYIKYVLDCQQIEPVGKDTDLSGFFYRDLNRKQAVHYIHQSREQIYMQALDALCATQPHHPDYGAWKSAVSRYGNYLKGLMAYTAPYGMVPSGVYRDDEYLDKEGFYALHLFPPSNADTLYREQLAGGVKVDDHFYVKRFPVWFNIFNGNTAVHTSVGKSAAICARMLNDDALRDIALEQLYWTVGKNPFAQSLIYGVGYNYPQLNSFSSGEIAGSIPVGIRTLGNSDMPYWPQINNACYKEVWVTSAGKFLSLLAEIAGN